jgi:NADH-quinone oxidoreductase subunit C
MDLKIKEVEQVINSELTSKIKNTSINFDELLVETTQDNLIQVILFLKSHEKLKFRQLIDIAGVDYPAEEKRFKLIYLLLSHEMNKRIKISISFEIGKKIPNLT